eukprot:Opistho-2@42900
MANGSWRRVPTADSAAAVVSDDTADPMYVPCCQLNDSYTSGTRFGRRPPKTIAEMGTPSGVSQLGSMMGHCLLDTVKREFGCAAGFVLSPAVHGSPSQLVILPFGGSFVIPSHQTSPSSVRATFVNTVLVSMERIALGFVWYDVPGATPKNPFSGLIAWRRPSLPNFIQAISSPTHSTFHPGRVGWSMARLVLPHAEGNAAAMYFLSPWGLVMPRINMCSASHPSSRPRTDAMRRAKHFFPSSELPPYPLPNDQISRVSGKWTIARSFVLQGHGTSFSPSLRGLPIECTHGTKSLLPSALMTSAPIRVIMRMLATT